MVNKKKCQIDGCNNGAGGRYCATHYARIRKYNDPHYISRARNGQGSITGKYKVLYKPDHPNSWKNGKIYEHIYLMSQLLGREIRKNEKVIHLNGNTLDNRIENLRLEKKKYKCVAPSCLEKIRCKGLCEKHYRAAIAHGDPNIKLRNLNGEGTINQYGYRLLFMPEHPNSNASGRILEHRYIMSKKLGRPLRKNENVHHINGNKLDNREENLELWIKSQPPGQKAKDMLKWAREIIIKYGHEEHEI